MVDKINNTNINNIKIVVPTTKPRRKYTSKTRERGGGGLDGASQRLSTLQNRASSSGVQPNISVGGPTIMIPSNIGPVATTTPQVPVEPSAIIPVSKPTFTTPKKIPMGGAEPVGGASVAPLYDSKTADKKTSLTSNYGEVIPPQKKDTSLHPTSTDDTVTRTPRRRRDTNVLVESLTAQQRADLVFHRGTPPISKVVDLRGSPARDVRVDSRGNIVSATTPVYKSADAYDVHGPNLKSPTLPLPPVRTQKTPRPISPSQRQRQSDSRLAKPNTSIGGLRGDLR